MKKIDLTCRKVSLRDLIQCNYNLNDSEYLIFNEIIKNRSGLSVKQLVEIFGKERTTIQKILSKLVKKNLLTKRQVNLERGFMFLYISKNKKDLVKEIEVNLISYLNSMKESLEKWKNNLN